MDDHETAELALHEAEKKATDREIAPSIHREVEEKETLSQKLE